MRSELPKMQVIAHKMPIIKVNKGFYSTFYQKRQGKGTICWRINCFWKYKYTNNLEVKTSRMYLKMNTEGLKESSEFIGKDGLKCNDAHGFSIIIH
jgi:hypothetical protein